MTIFDDKVQYEINVLLTTVYLHTSTFSSFKKFKHEYNFS